MQARRRAGVPAARRQEAVVCFVHVRRLRTTAPPTPWQPTQTSPAACGGKGECEQCRTCTAPTVCNGCRSAASTRLGSAATCGLRFPSGSESHAPRSAAVSATPAHSMRSVDVPGGWTIRRVQRDVADEGDHADQHGGRYEPRCAHGSWLAMRRRKQGPLTPCKAMEPPRTRDQSRPRSHRARGAPHGWARSPASAMRRAARISFAPLRMVAPEARRRGAGPVGRSCAVDCRDHVPFRWIGPATGARGAISLLGDRLLTRQASARTRGVAPFSWATLRISISSTRSDPFIRWRMMSLASC